MTKIHSIRCTVFTFGIVYIIQAGAQPFYFGADLSYVNEMEDCGVVYKENNVEKDVYQIFADHQVNLVRYRIWHTPSWYDNLNAGNRYSDYSDVKRAIARAKAEGMHVLLDFHLSDNWADPGKQVVPAAWASIVDDLPVLKDSLYNYIYSILTGLHAEDLLPEMVQIGNETNRGILLSQEQNDAGWVLEWDRNSQLFNRAIDAVQDVETATGEDIVIALHAAGPEDAVWIYDQFIDNGVTEFDVMGISYYWAWHRPTTIAETGQIIEELRADHPGYDVMIFETGYIWTTQGNDNAGNIITVTHEDYHPASPDNQRRFLVDLTQEVINSGGKGVIYWEPAWVSSPCWTQWGQGSHQEHATFFDFSNNLHGSGGIGWASHPYENLVSTKSTERDKDAFQITLDSNNVIIRYDALYIDNGIKVMLVNTSGQLLLQERIPTEATEHQIALPVDRMAPGIYYVILTSGPHRMYTQKVQFLK